MDRFGGNVLRKLLVAALACITLFLSQRALTDSRPRPAPQADRDDAPEPAPSSAVKIVRTAVLF